MATKIENLEDLYVDLLKDLYSAEKQLIKALPKMAKAAHSPELRKGFEEHLRQTEHQAERIERIFSQRADGAPGGKKCVGMEGLIEEGSELMKEDVEDHVLDAGLIAAAQKVEHYEISGYGTARAWARKLGYDDAARLLQETLDEEAMTDEKLTKLAEANINRKAE
ncbi:MAG: ferritin-like domain-containing protein [Bacteroidota bacterium]